MKLSGLLKPTIILLLILPVQIYASELYYIDAHSQADHQVDLPLIIQQMDEHNVYRTILASRSKLRSSKIADFAESNPKRIIPSVRIKSGAYIKNKQKYYKKLSRQLESGRYNAIAEVLMYHAQKGDKAPEVEIYPDDPRVEAALQGALENSWPFIIHIEFSSLHGQKRTDFMRGMEELIDRHPAHPFAVIHMGQLQSNEVRVLINKHKNIYFITSHSNPVTVNNSSQPWTVMFNGNTLTAAWKELFITHPDRFIFAIDNVWEHHWSNEYAEVMEYWNHALADLPEEVAHAFAHGNAERLWKLEPKQ